MNWTEILSNLCYYDKRNPEYIDNEEYYNNRLKKKGSCSCDNCYYRRTELAEEIIKLMINNTI